MFPFITVVTGNEKDIKIIGTREGVIKVTISKSAPNHADVNFICGLKILAKTGDHLKKRWKKSIT